jgi:uncharacterized hydrophobic protein (TIGR00271 family)
MLPFSPNRSASPRPEFSPERKNGKVVRSRKEAAYALPLASQVGRGDNEVNLVALWGRDWYPSCMLNPALQKRRSHGLQDRLLRLLGSRVEARADIVRGMLHRDANEAVSYWLQLSVSVGIATLGLVVGSSAVVIGAMLIAPLMGPIVALAMGLATGSPFLVLRSAGRILLSVTLALAGAAVITSLLPFHELNAEISGRTTPTVLDLLTAGFCALAGVYASLRPGSDTATTAAGTSIGISLVPPLCASGYGLGTLAWPVAGGAALLFLTNLVAIVAVGTVAFVAAGFNTVDVVHIERDVLAAGADAPLARWLASRLARLFESRFGPLLRFFMPFILLAAVYVPLRRALDEVAWEVRARKAVRDALASEPIRVVDSKSQVARHGIDLVVVVLGKAAEAEATRARLSRQIARASGIKPSIEVLAVPDATAFAGLESTLLTPRSTAATPERKPPMAEALTSTTTVESALKDAWPEASAGDLLSVALTSGEEETLVIQVTHWGNPLGAAAREALEKALSRSLEGRVVLRSVAIDGQPITRREGDLLFLGRASAAASAARTANGVGICLDRPDVGETKSSLTAKDKELAGALDTLLDAQPGVTVVSGKSFQLRLTRGTCTDTNGTFSSGARGPVVGAPDRAR